MATLAGGTLLGIAGVGAAAATRTATQLHAAGATALVSWGMAGGLDPALQAGNVVLPAHIISAAGASLPTDPLWRAQLSAALATQAPHAHGRLLTATSAVTSTAAKATLFRETGAAAVDMESIAIALVAQAHGLRFVAVRVIVDVAGDALPAVVVNAADATGRVRAGRLLGRLLRRPRDLAPLAHLAWRYVQANRALALAARSGALSAPPPASA